MIGKNQLALLLIVDQSTREIAGGRVGRTFTVKKSIRYTRLDGESDTFFMMTRDLRSLERLVRRGLIRRHQSPDNYGEYYTVTDSGRAEIRRLAERAVR